MAGAWIAVAAAEHVAAGAREGIFACSHGDGRAAARPVEGDRFAYYAPREGSRPARRSRLSWRSAGSSMPARAGIG